MSFNLQKLQQKTHIKCWWKSYREKDEILLVVFANAVVDPRTVVIHLSNTALAHGAVVGTFGLDAAALGTLEDHLTLAVAHLLDKLLCGVAPWHGTLQNSAGQKDRIQKNSSYRIREHGAHMRSKGQECKNLEQQ